MKTPNEIYLFETDGQMVWCDTDESDGDAVKYVRADTVIADYQRVAVATPEEEREFERLGL